MQLDFPLTAFLHFDLVQIVLLLIFIVPSLYVMLTGAPFVPTQMPQARRMLKAAKLKPGMKLYDLGAGDGRLVHLASKDYKVEAVGVEYSPLVWFWSKCLGPFWKSQAKLSFGNIWTKDLSDADVIVCYLLPHMMKRIQKDIWPKLKPGTVIISHAFSMPDLELLKKLPRDKVQGLGPVWIYKKTQQKKSK